MVFFLRGMNVDKNRINLDEFFSDDYEEDSEEYGYEDYEEYLEDDIYADHDEYDGVEVYGGEDSIDGLTRPKGKAQAPAGRSVPGMAPAARQPAAESVGESGADTGTPAVPQDELPEPPKGDGKTFPEVPKPVMEIIDILKEHTYTSYLVGDCVNMLILGERVMDFDIACSAAIERIIAIFEDRFKVREDLLERGELIIINGAMGISVAPYRSRIDGSGKPIYCKTIDEDLHRRTFTSEAVAYNPDAGIYDKFGGLGCITEEKTILRAIDEEQYERLEFEQARIKKKSKELPKKIVIPALRDNPECIMTAMLKFARGEAEMSPFTLRNINDNAELIDMIMPAEITRYFRRIIMGRRITETLMNFREVVFRIFPILREQYGFEQKSDYQEYTLYEHTAKAVGYAIPDYTVRLALLLHAIGKPDCAADRGDYMTFYGHAERGAMLADDVFRDYEAEESIIDRVKFMILHHDDHISPENLTEFTGFFGAENTRQLLLFQSANIRAKGSDPVNERVSSTLRQLADGLSGSNQTRFAGRRQ